MRHLEHDHAVCLNRWWSYTAENVFGVDSRLLAAIPNGGHRHISVARKLKEEGVRPGIPDFFLFVPFQGYHGLAIELKAPTKTARLSDAQKAMKCLMEAQGYVFKVCYGWDEAKSAIEGYLGESGYKTIKKKELANLDSGPMEDLKDAKK